VRIHHAYVGALGSAGAFLLPPDQAATAWALRIGLGLLLSDLVHHFVVLRFATGDPQFHLTYAELPREECSVSGRD